MGSPAGRKGLLRSRRPGVLQIVEPEREQVLNTRADERDAIYHARFKLETCNRFDSGIVEDAVVRLDNHDIHDFSFGSYIELKTWAFRFPHLAVVVYPLACVAILPAIPVFAGIAHRATLVRWGASVLAAGLVTASMLLLMQLSILIG